METSINDTGVAMKRLAVFFSAVVMCLAAMTFTFGQSGSPKPLPASVCRAITTYVAKIDAARSISEKSKREVKYAEAKDEVSLVLNKYGETTLLTEAFSYAKYTETIATADPGRTDLADDLDKRLKSRSALLGRCSDYTSSR